MSQLVSLASLTRRTDQSITSRPGAGERESRLQRAIVKKAGRAIADFEMIAEGDLVMACVSGGKDSYAMLDVLRTLQRRAPVRFDILAVNIDQGWPGYDTATIAAHLERTGVAFRMIDKDFASVVEANLEPGDTPCSLCSRLRRGVLYNLAVELGCSKIALGHHADDLIETLLLNLFYSGRLAAMPAKLRSDDGRNTVIRPLCYVPEAMLVALQEEEEYPVVRCGCPSCGLPDQKRQVVKRLLGSLEQAEPGLKHHMLAALKNVKPSQLLDRALQSRPAAAAKVDSEA
jgi:tRNA 2-thiocytidine biosynthesis protein TtcA